MARKLLLGAVVLALLALGAVAAFVLTFDADRYRPLLVSRLEEAIGQPVSLERLSLGWQGGIALQAHGFAIGGPAATQGKPVLAVEQISGLARLAPLLRRQLEVSSVVITRPQVRVVRDAQGKVNVLGLAALAAPAAAPSAPQAAQAPVAFRVDRLRIEGGHVTWEDYGVAPPAEVSLSALDVEVRNIAPGAPMDMELSAALAGEAPNVRVRGHLTLPRPRFSGSLENLHVEADQIALERLLPPVPAEATTLRGRMSLRLDGTMPNLGPVALPLTAEASGTIAVDEPVVTNLNILRTAFAQFSMIPGLVEKLQERLPPDYQAKLQAKDTRLSPIRLDARLAQGSIRFDQATLATDTFQLTGSGTVGLDGTITMRAMLAVEPQLSAALVQSVKELGGLLNRSGSMEFPVTVHGRPPQVAVAVDLQYVASRVVVRAAVTALDEWLRRREGSDAQEPAADQPATEQAPASSPPEEDPLGSFLRRALEE